MFRGGHYLCHISTTSLKLNKTQKSIKSKAGYQSAAASRSVGGPAATFPVSFFSAAAPAAGLTGDHQGHRVSLIVVIHNNLTVVSAWVVGAETGDLHGTIQRVGRVSWQRDAAPESLIHLDYITFGTEKQVFFLIQSVHSEPAAFTKSGQKTYSY